MDEPSSKCFVKNLLNTKTTEVTEYVRFQRSCFDSRQSKRS